MPGILVSAKHFRLLFASILLFGVALRVYCLQADAPLDISLYYGRTNDGAATVAAARDRIVFGAWWPSWEIGSIYRAFPDTSWLTHYPDLMPHIRLIKQYELRDNLAHVYEVAT